jgi:hypothetical protein
MIEVTQQDDKTFTISWDENDPTEKVFNDYTEEDFITLIQNYLQSLQESGEVDINQVTEAVNNINDHIEEEIIATCEETFGKENCHNNTAKKKNNKHSDKSKAISRRLKEIYKERNKIYDWYKVKEEAIREYQDNELKED